MPKASNVQSGNFSINLRYFGSSTGRSTKTKLFYKYKGGYTKESGLPPFSEYFIDIPLANIAKLNSTKLDQITRDLKEYELLRGPHAD
jgi:hypothetical protein